MRNLNFLIPIRSNHTALQDEMLQRVQLSHHGTLHRHQRHHRHRLLFCHTSRPKNVDLPEPPNGPGRSQKNEFRPPCFFSLLHDRSANAREHSAKNEEGRHFEDICYSLRCALLSLVGNTFFVKPFVKQHALFGSIRCVNYVVFRMLSLSCGFDPKKRSLNQERGSNVGSRVENFDPPDL